MLLSQHLHFTAFKIAAHLAAGAKLSERAHAIDDLAYAHKRYVESQHVRR